MDSFDIGFDFSDLKMYRLLNNGDSSFRISPFFLLWSKSSSSADDDSGVRKVWYSSVESS